MKMVLVIASNNEKKIKEVQSLLPHFQIKSLKDIGCHVDIPETADTFEGNALLNQREEDYASALQSVGP